MQTLATMRMGRAATLLGETDLPTKEIAAMVGVTWIGSFGRAFQATHGLSPAKYRAQARQAGRDAR